jgi:hypothetical protein
MGKYNVLLTCMGGYGAVNFADDVKNSRIGHKIKFFGSHADKYLLSRSSTENNYLVPWAKDERNYIEAMNQIIENEKIDLVIPKSDREVAVVSKNRHKIQCNLFLPEDSEIEAAQDKLSFAKILEKRSINIAKTYGLTDFDMINETLEKLPNAEKYFVRVKTAGAPGAIAATWVNNANQAIMWIKLWQELHSIELSEFTISEFLPGRLFECIVIYKEGELKTAKFYENLRYYGADQRLSGMESTPEVARTSDDESGLQALKESIKAVEGVASHVGTKPNGVYHLSSKANKKGDPCITECNIGRTPSTVSFFNRTGKNNISEMYVRFGLKMREEQIGDVFDIEKEEIYMIRSLDHELVLLKKQEIEKKIIDIS